MRKDLISYVNIFKQEGTSRKERYADLLDPSTISVDDRKLEDFIIYAQQYSKNVLFVDTLQEPVDPDKTWEWFFKDSSVLLGANIATKDINEIKAQYDLLFNQFQRRETLEDFVPVVEYVFSRFKKIDQWYASSSAENILNQHLNLYISSYLVKEFQSLNQIILHVNSLIKGDQKKLSVSSDLINKHNIWELVEIEPASLGAHIFAGSTDREKLNNALLFVNKIFDTVFYTTSRIIEASKKYFNDSIFKQQDVAPHIALFITFVKLYGIVQQELNKLPAKLLSFYYKDVLRIKPKGPAPDQAFIFFELTKGFDFYKIEKDTPLLAGKDKNKTDLVYTTDKEIIVNNARVSALKTIYTHKKGNLVIQHYRHTVKQKEELPPENTLTPDFSQKLFGAPGNGREAQTGLAIASPQFYLAKGERSVRITFEMSAEPAGAADWKDLDTSIIELRLTGEEGWISSSNAKDSVFINYFRRSGDTNLELDFRISVVQPSAIVAYDDGIHGGGFNVNIPVLKMLLLYPLTSPEKDADIPEESLLKIRQLNYLLSLNVLKTTIRVQQGTIGEKVTFDGITDVHIENHEAALDAKKPFYPFTAMPKVGSSFYINCDELSYKKDIESLNVNIDWMLPDNFYSYYDKYFPPYDSNKFQASLSVLKDTHWIKLKDISIIDTNADEPRYRVIKVPNKPAPPGERPAEGTDVSKFDISKKEGTIRLKLNYPDFGHDIYAQLITSIAMEKASSKRASVDFYKIIEKEFGDSDISIKLPPPTHPSYRINRVLDILRDADLKDRAKGMIIEALNYSLISYNGVTLPSRGVQQASLEITKTLVNDPNNFIARILKFLKRIKLIDKNIHYDQDRETVGSLVTGIEDKLLSYIDFILPADQEMIALIISAVNNAIRKVIVKAVDKIIEIKNTQQPDDNTVTAIITREFDSANKVINDLVAGKIASLLIAQDVPPQPYTPLINTIAISYVSVKEAKSNEERFFHILPFGIAETNPFTPLPPSAKNIALPTGKMFPRSFVPSELPAISPAGIFFIGISGLTLNENLSLLFQLDQAGARSAKKPPAVSWWYLAGNEWIPLKKDLIVLDSTEGLQTTGIIEISAPQNINNHNTIFDEPGLFWLCASVPGDLDAFPGVKDVNAQAVRVTFKNNSNDPLHFASPLPAKKINRLAEPLPGIKAVQHPAASFNGKMEESDPGFYARVSERLRHKSRAINNWDYERLVLEQFPFIYKVKCLNNYFLGKFVPGHVTVVPIVNLKNKSDSLYAEMPVASYLQLKRIEDFLKSKTSVFAKVHAINPQADYVKITCRVKLNAGVNKGYYLQKLNEDLVRFLTPWAADTNAPSFSTKIYSSSIISFMDKLEYVDYVADLSMNQFTISEDGAINYYRLANNTISLTETQISTAHSILVSARHHDIELA